jgi:hypothetical protein
MADTPLPEAQASTLVAGTPEDERGLDQLLELWKIVELVGYAPRELGSRFDVQVDVWLR